jgi:phosphoenolpyruvate carboxykinase (ATP)
LPPISRLTAGQAKFFFINGYTAKIPGTEVTVTEPKPTFSACFGAAFLPLHPTKYATMLGEKLNAHKANVWLINTGYTGSAYTKGKKRTNLGYTRASITAALNGELDHVAYETLPVFGLQVPKTCPNVPSKFLNPVWENENDYQEAAKKLGVLFNTNFKKYSDQADDETLNAAPKY